MARSLSTGAPRRSGACPVDGQRARGAGGGGRPLVDVLTAFLRDRQLLLALDNFEHLLPAAPVVSDLLRVSGVKILAPAVRPGLRGEREYPGRPPWLSPTQAGPSQLPN